MLRGRWAHSLLHSCLEGVTAVIRTTTSIMKTTSRTAGKTYIETTHNICQHPSESLEHPPLGYQGYDTEKTALLYVSCDETENRLQSPARKNPKRTFRVIPWWKYILDQLFQYFHQKAFSIFWTWVEFIRNVENFHDRLSQCPETGFGVFEILKLKT